MKFTIRLSDNFGRQLRVKCAQDGLRLQDAFAQAVFAWLHPSAVRVRNPAYLYDPDADYLARVENGEEPDDARSVVLSKCKEHEIEDWEPGQGGWARPDPSGFVSEEKEKEDVDVSEFSVSIDS